MGWFENSDEKENSLPKLPELPELPTIEKEERDKNESLPQLPSLPSNSFGDKFSQNAIKHAVSGGKEVDMEREEEEINLPSPKELPSPLEVVKNMEPRKPLREEIGEIPGKIVETGRRLKKTEPVFIRIDKFEEAMNIFEKAKKEITEIEKALAETKQLKQQEEQELVAWENEIQSIKQQISKIDSDIFSKIE
jgi:hypothetical protein